MDEDFELISMITDEIYDFLGDIGIEPVQFSYDDFFDAEDNAYRAVVRVTKGPIDGVMDAFVEYQDEFSSHMSALFPGVEVSLILEVEDDEVSGDYGARSVEFMGEDDEDTNCLDDENAEHTDSVERQYEDEGLNIIDEDDETQFCTDEELLEKVIDKRRSEYDPEYDDADDDPLLDDSIYRPQSDVDEDYSPSAEDMEDLWRSFGEQGDDYE